MILALQIILLLAIAISFVGVIGTTDEKLRTHMLSVFISGLIAFLVSVVFI